MGKAESDSQILETLEHIEFMLDNFKHCTESGTILLLHFYRKLPDPVAHRLSELDPETVEDTASGDQELASAAINKLNGSSALNQICRAEHVYRKRLGLTAIDADSQ